MLMLTYHISYIIWENDVIQGISQLYRSLAMTNQATLGNFGRVWTSDVIGDHHVSFTIHLALRLTTAVV